jgi:hypothetical protein
VREVVWKPRLNVGPGQQGISRKGVGWLKGTFALRGPAYFGCGRAIHPDGGFTVIVRFERFGRHAANALPREPGSRIALGFDQPNAQQFG